MKKSIIALLVLALASGCAASAADDSGAAPVSELNEGSLSVEEAGLAVGEARKKALAAHQEGKDLDTVLGNAFADVADRVASTNLLTVFNDQIPYGGPRMFDVFAARTTFGRAIPADLHQLRTFLFASGVGGRDSLTFSVARVSLAASMLARLPGTTDYEIMDVVAAAAYSAKGQDYFAAVKAAGFDRAPRGPGFEWGLSALANDAVVYGVLGGRDGAALHDLASTTSFQAVVFGRFFSKVADIRPGFLSGDIVVLCDRLNDVAAHGAEPENAMSVARASMPAAAFASLEELRRIRK